MKIEKWELVGLFALIALIIASVFGWVMNVIQIIHSSAIDRLVIVRIIGVFMGPLGAVLGYL